MIAEAARFLQGGTRGDDEEKTRRNRWWMAAVAAALAVCLPALIVAVTAGRDPLRKLKALTAGLPARPIEGRLADFEYAPFSSMRAEPVKEQPVAILAEAERLNEQGDGGARSRHARGIALLLTHDTAGAVGQLSAAAQSDSDNASFWNDLAVAHLARRDHDRAAVAAALAATDRALTLSPSFAAAHFNRGLSLELLGKPAEAILAYRRAVELEPRSRWAGELTARIARLQE